MVFHVTISGDRDGVIITVKLTSKSHLYASLNTNDMTIWLSSFLFSGESRNRYLKHRRRRIFYFLIIYER